MCAIVGVLGEAVPGPAALAPMMASVAHRGPDDQGIWVDQAAQVALGHCRLSVIDVSPAGHQPMVSSNGRFVLTYNGEIYNFLELRDELEQRGSAPDGGWRSQSDTEVLLEAIACWGLETALARSSGMFAFALWDRRERQLTLVRDRFGEKPLYYGWVAKKFVFGSELKALRADPEFGNAISRDSASLFLRRKYVPAPLSIYERIYKLRPGCLLQISRAGTATPLDVPPEEGQSAPGVRLKRYWAYKDVVSRGLADPFADEAEALAQLDHALSQAVRRQSCADVPIGAFLSGGIDSSLIVALHQQHSAKTVRTFSIGFGEAAYNEAHHARQMAAHLGTLHREEYVTPERSRDVIASLPLIYDEPFADASQIATLLLSRLAKGDVTVALTGDGGDELFAGYYHHFLAPRVWGHLQALPKAGRRVLTSLLSRVPPIMWEQAAGLVAGRKQRHIGFKVQGALRAACKSDRLEDIYRSLVDEWDFGSSLLLEANACDLPHDLTIDVQASDTDRIMYCDAVSYLPGDILCKVDRASMAAGLETRAPFLDHHVAEVAARIPLRMKVRGGRGKSILRRLLYRYSPPQLVDRPKNGFAVPIGEWITGPLRPWAEDVLDSSRMGQEGWLDPNIVKACWHDHLSGKRDASGALWTVMMFNSWLRHCGENLEGLTGQGSGKGAPIFWGKSESRTETSKQWLPV